MSALPLDLYRRARSLGLHVESDGIDLLIKPRSKCPPDFAAVLREHKTELLRWLNSPPNPQWQAIPPNDLPLIPIMPNPTLENRERIIGYLLRQGCDRPGPLTEWLLRRECAYYDGAGRHWDCSLHAYVAARDAACWQLQKTEAAVCEFLTTFDNSPPFLHQ